jgi:hypothetical protein
MHPPRATNPPQRIVAEAGIAVLMHVCSPPLPGASAESRRGQLTSFEPQISNKPGKRKLSLPMRRLKRNKVTTTLIFSCIILKEAIFSETALYTAENVMTVSSEVLSFEYAKCVGMIKRRTKCSFLSSC